MAPWRERYLVSRGVDVSRLHRVKENFADITAHKVAAYRHTSGMRLRGNKPILRQGDDEEEFCEPGDENCCDPEEDELCPKLTTAEKLAYAEAIITGIIDGIVAYFSTDCYVGLIGLVSSAFRIVDHYEIWIPSNTMKFNMSLTNLTEAGNVVFAYCDVSHFQHEIMVYADYENWENYVNLAGRIGGVMVADFWKYYECIKEGKYGGNGFDVGMCAGKIVSLMIDTLF